MRTIRLANRRFQRVLDPPLQYGVASRLVATGIVYFLLSTFVCVVLPGFHEQAMEGTPESPRPAVLGKSFLAPLVITAGAIWVHCVLALFRVAGPALRLRQAFADLRSRNVPREVRVRRDDHLQETVESLNLALETLSGDLAAWKHLTGIVMESRAALQRAGPEGRAAAQALRELSASLRAYQLHERLPEPDHEESYEPSSS